MTAIDRLLDELQTRHCEAGRDLNGLPCDTGRTRAVVLQLVNGSVRVSVTDDVRFSEIICDRTLEADGLTAEDAAEKLLSPGPFAAKE